MKNPYLNLLSNSWKYAANLRKKMFITYAMFVVANCIDLVGPIIFGLFLNIIQNNEPELLQKSLIYLGIYGSLPFFVWIFHGNARIFERDTAFFIERNFREKMFETITHLPYQWHQDHHTGSTYNRINKAALALRNFNEDGFQYISTIVNLLFSTVALVVLAPLIGGSVVLVSILTLYIMGRFDHRIMHLREEINRREHHLTAGFFDYISNIITVISLRLEQLTRHEIVKRYMHIHPVFRSETRVNEWKWFTISMLMALVRFLSLFLYIYLALSSGQPLLIGTLMIVYQFTDKLIHSIYEVAWKYERVALYNADILGIEPITKALKGESLAADHPADGGKWQKITISNLCFSHPSSTDRQQSLDHIDLILERGKKIALVGESGSGKSTTMALIRGLYEVQKVELAIDEQIFYSLKTLSATTSLIPQDPEIFENTIEYNITLGIHHSKKELEKACELACFDKVIEKLPSGYKSDIREKGVNLSGGEKQRLALARGIFSAKDSTILLLDEPTSSVDPANERKIYKNLFEHFQDRCIVASVHRLHLLRNFDYIYVFERGKITEKGSYSKLVEQNGTFKKMLEHYEHHPE